MTASAEQLKQALQNSPMADAPEVRAAAAASSRVLRGRFRSRRLFLFLFSEHFEPVSLHGYHRRLKSPLVAVGPLEFERKKRSTNQQQLPTYSASKDTNAGPCSHPRASAGGGVKADIIELTGSPAGTSAGSAMGPWTPGEKMDVDPRRDSENQ